MRRVAASENIIPATADQEQNSSFQFRQLGPTVRQ